ncbi:MAG TPA: OsmC family protein, partial [Acidimicrobiia bacterium]|nr:OsmC family protein [Acidimicrobiia bacterium]
IVDDSTKAATTWSASVRWTGSFRSEATVREFAPIPSDEPVGLGGTDGAPNPVEQLLAALGNCLAVGYAANASVAGIELNDLRVELEGDLDLHTFLGLRDGNAGFETIRVAVHIDSDADQDALVALHQKVTATSPVGHTLTRAIPVDIQLA